MNKNLNLVEILKDAPKGTKLWSPICGECELVAVEENCSDPILCKASDGNNIKFTNLGKYYSILFKNGECVLFPSKENRDWSTFKVSEGHKHVVPFQRVFAHSTMNMAMKYGLPTSIAIMMNLPANIFLLVDMWVMIMRSFPTRVMKISLVKA